MKKRTSLRIADVAAALREANGNRSAVAKQLGISRTRLSALIEKRESLQEVESEIHESWVDQAEVELLSTKTEMDFRKVQLILKTYGVSRGYGAVPPSKPAVPSTPSGPFNVTTAIPRPDFTLEDDQESSGQGESE